MGSKSEISVNGYFGVISDFKSRKLESRRKKFAGAFFAFRNHFVIAVAIGRIHEDMTEKKNIEAVGPEIAKI